MTVTLLLYVYADTHEYAYGNLKYFIETDVRERDGVDYIFILQQVENKTINEEEMPPLPKGNAFYFQHENRCFDYGTIGWFIERYTIGNPWKNSMSLMNNIYHRKFNLKQYRYFILMNSSVRGPFFPPYFLQFLSDYQIDFNEIFHWYAIFTRRISDRVKLAGSTISCDISLHVQSYFLTTDFQGFSILLKHDAVDGTLGMGRVFECYPSKSDTIKFSELGISTVLLQVNYTLTSLLTIYDTLEFSNKHHCKSPIGGNPYQDKNMDGTSLEPYEVVFVKFNGMEMTCDAQNRAKLYQSRAGTGPANRFRSGRTGTGPDRTG